MAVDTRAKRASVANAISPYYGPGVTPGNVLLTAEQRCSVLWTYCGFDIDEPSTPVVPPTPAPPEPKTAELGGGFSLRGPATGPEQSKRDIELAAAVYFVFLVSR